MRVSKITDIEKIFNEIRDCARCPFKDKGFTFYADHTTPYEFMLVLQNPLSTSKRRSLEMEEAESAHNLKQRVKVHQRYFSDWFLFRKNRKFIERFLNLFKEYKLIDLDNHEEYIKHEFFDDFYVTDLIKYWCTTSEIEEKHVEHAVKHLQREISLVKPRLIISFGTRVWEALKGQFKLKAYQRWESKVDPDRDKETVSNVHGFLFKSCSPPPNHEVFVIPLVHLSARTRNMLLRDSYIQYLREGIQLYARKRSSSRKVT